MLSDSDTTAVLSETFEYWLTFTWNYTILSQFCMS